MARAMPTRSMQPVHQSQSQSQYQYQHLLESFVDPQRTPQANAPRRASFSQQQQHAQQQQRLTPEAAALRRSSFANERHSAGNVLRVTTRDITAILSVAIKVEGYQYDSSIMEHPEFLISTSIVFQCKKFGSKQLETTWRLYRTFQEFLGLDLQLRQKFPFDMCEIHPPRLHKRKSFFRLHRTKSFLKKRCGELNAYLAEVLDASTMRLTRFMDPRAPLILRCFCNFDVGFGKKMRVRPTQYDSCTFYLDHHHHHHHHHGAGRASRLSTSIPEADAEREHNSSPLPLTPGAVAADTELMQTQEQELHNRLRIKSQSMSTMGDGTRSERSRADSRFDDLEANLLDDRARNMAMCLRYDCSCQHMPFRVIENKMARILRMRNFRQSYHPVDPNGPSALYCILYRLQQYNSLDRKLYDILSDYSGGTKTDSHGTASEDGGDGDGHDRDAQLTAGVELLREAIANYALLYVHTLEPHFRMSVVDLTKKIHEFKSGQQQRVGALELVVLCSMLDLSIVLITNDHEGTVQEIFPLPGLPPLRRGGRMLVTMGYILPTMQCVNGLYLLAEEVEQASSNPNGTGAPAAADGIGRDPKMWQGLEEIDRCLITLIETQVLQSELQQLDTDLFDHDLAETLNKALLEAVWNDCGHNPNLFHLFQRHARQFGKSRIPASGFFQYLEVAFGLEGASYLVDFLLHVLPEATLRKQLVRARWRRVQRHLAKRVAAVAS